jgi:hypothetical protein
MNLFVKFTRSKITLSVLLVCSVFITIIQTMNALNKNTLTLSIIYFSIILSSVLIIVNIFFTYFFNLLIYKFIVGKNFSNKIIFFNIILIQLILNTVFIMLIKYLFEITNFWFLVFNPFYLFMQYILYLYLIKYELASSKRVLIYIVINLILPILFHFITVRYS